MIDPARRSGAAARAAVRRGALVILAAAGIVLAGCGSAPGPTSTLPPGGGPSAAPVAVDASLLELLPPMVDGLDRQTQPDVDADLAADPSLASVATALATALYADPATGDFAYVAVVRLADPMTDAAYRDWRDTFDEGACGQAGGVSGHAETAIGGHDTYIGTCGAGIRTYHTTVDDGTVLISVSSLGETRRLGELVIETLPG